MVDLAVLRHETQAWLADDPDEDDRAELQTVLDGLPATAIELADRFVGPLTFGTAGLRGPLRAGPHGVNRAVVRAAAAGLVRLLAATAVQGTAVPGFARPHRPP